MLFEAKNNSKGLNLFEREVSRTHLLTFGIATLWTCYHNLSAEIERTR